jgi:hypothetical protein
MVRLTMLLMFLISCKQVLTVKSIDHLEITFHWI